MRALCDEESGNTQSKPCMRVCLLSLLAGWQSAFLATWLRHVAVEQAVRQHAQASERHCLQCQQHPRGESERHTCKPAAAQQARGEQQGAAAARTDLSTSGMEQYAAIANGSSRATCGSRFFRPYSHTNATKAVLPATPMLASMLICMYCQSNSMPLAPIHNGRSRCSSDSAVAHPGLWRSRPQ